MEIIEFEPRISIVSRFLVDQNISHKRTGGAIYMFKCKTKIRFSLYGSVMCFIKCFNSVSECIPKNSLMCSKPMHFLVRSNARDLAKDAICKVYATGFKKFHSRKIRESLLRHKDRTLKRSYNRINSYDNSNNIQIVSCSNQI